MSEQDGKQASTLQRPTTNSNQEAWKAYWKAQSQPWRTEPEIDMERQKYLTERRSITPDIKQGVYPFKDIEPKLTRADVEWLLATHENGRGPVYWSDQQQRQREGLDLRGADLRQENLMGLPLAQIRGGLTFDESRHATVEQRDMAAILLKRANLREAQLQKANLREAQLQGAEFPEAQLQGANLQWAELQEAYLANVRLQGAYLRGIKLQGAHLAGAQLQGADLRGAVLENVTLDQVTLSDEKHGSALLADIRWDEINLAVVDWTPVKRLGDERLARQTKEIDDYRAAVRANRQLAVVLRDQGLNEEADHFAYRAQRLQWIVSRKQRKYGRYLFSGFLDLLAGYGYRPLRSLFWYLVIIFVFAMAYSTFGHLSPWPPDAFVYSLTSFHGRGFFPGLEGKHSLHDPLIMLAAFEAVVGLFIEISFIATFTQRFFGR